jgi:FkbM family methyltransferase
LAGDTIAVGDVTVRIPGPLRIRLSVIAGNIRLHRLMTATIAPGATVVDVGANIGYNTIYGAWRVGPAGRVVAIEPAPDNVRVLRENVQANHFRNVVIHPVAAGRTHEERSLFLRGDVSAVNSLFPQSVYGRVTRIERIRVVPLDDLVEGAADVVKIDVEGAELDVLAGMPRLLAHRSIQLIVEWHPLLQQSAGYPPDALPLALMDNGFRLRGVWHTSSGPIDASNIAQMTSRLRRSQRPVELLAMR